MKFNLIFIFFPFLLQKIGSFLDDNSPKSHFEKEKDFDNEKNIKDKKITFKKTTHSVYILIKFISSLFNF